MRSLPSQGFSGERAKFRRSALALYLTKKQLEAVLQADRSEDLIEAVNRIEQLVAVRI